MCACRSKKLGQTDLDREENVAYAALFNNGFLALLNLELTRGMNF